MALRSTWRVRGGSGFAEVDIDESAAMIAQEHKLWGGVRVGKHIDRFFGSVYSDMVQGITGESLYQDYITPDRVKKMADLLQACSYQQARTKMGSVILEPDEYRNLQVTFSVWAKAGAGLIGEW